MLSLKKGDKVIYLGDMPYKLANNQEVEKEGEELFIQSNVNVQKRFFSLIEEEKVEEVVKSELKELPEKELNKKDDKKIDNKSKKKNSK